MDEHGKSQLKINGEYLLNTLQDINILIINTCFPRNLAHYTTCIFSQSNGDINDQDNAMRQNRYRNQLYYIFVNKSQKCIATNSQALNLKPTKSSLRCKWSWSCGKCLRKRQGTNQSIEKISMINSYAKNIRAKS